MKAVVANIVCRVFLLLVPWVSEPVLAQATQATLSGTVTSSSGAAVANAKISVENLRSGEIATAQTSSDGVYKVPNITPGEYEVSAAADGFTPKVSNITIGAGGAETMNMALDTLPNAPSSAQTQPSLQDLGFPAEQTQANPKEQALLDKRTHMLKIHQRMGLITTAPLLATLITSVGAGGKHTSDTDRTVHMVLGATTADLYFITAYYAIRAPKPAGTPTRGPIRFHKAMAWIHGPGMILTPILGAMAYSQKNNGEKVHGIAAAHGPVAIITAGAFGAALLSVSLKF